MKRILFTLVASISLFGSVWAQEAIKIGVITSLTGRFAEFGEQHKAGFLVALEQINAAGGIDGRLIELILEDDTSEQRLALSAAEKLLKKDVPIILGAYASSITNPLSQYLTREEFPFLVFTSSADSITCPGSEWVFRINQPATAYAEVLFDIYDDLRTKGETISSVALIHGNGSFETAVADAAKLLAADRDYDLVEAESYDKGITDFRPVLNRFKNASPDVVMMVSYAEDSVAVMRQTKEVGLNAKVFAGGAAGFALPNFVEGAGDAAEYVITATAWTKDVAYTGAEDLYTNLKEELAKEPSYHAAQAYAGLLTAADVLSRSESLESADIQEALEQTNLLETAYGPILFQTEGDCRNQNPIKMIAQQVIDGEFVTVFPEAAATNNLIYPTPNWSER